MQQKQRAVMTRLFASNTNQLTSVTSESEPTCDEISAVPEPEPESERQLAGSDDGIRTVEGGAAASAVTGSGSVPAQESAQEAGIPVPHIADEPQQRSMPVPIRPEIIVGRSLCDVRSEEAINDADRDSAPAKMGQTPPLLSMIRQTVQATREDDCR